MNYIDSNLKVVGTRPLRPDGVDKVTGRAMYSADTRVAGMLWGKILRSPHAHARIVKIDTSKAAAALTDASRALDKAVSKGVIHKNQAANRKSALASALAKK